MSSEWVMSCDVMCFRQVGRAVCSARLQPPCQPSAFYLPTQRTKTWRWDRAVRWVLTLPSLLTPPPIQVPHITPTTTSLEFVGSYVGCSMCQPCGQPWLITGNSEVLAVIRTKLRWNNSSPSAVFQRVWPGVQPPRTSGSAAVIHVCLWGAL